MSGSEHTCRWVIWLWYWKIGPYLEARWDKHSSQNGGGDPFHGDVQHLIKFIRHHTWYKQNIGKGKREGVLGSRSIAPRILNLGTRWRWVVRYTPRTLYHRIRAPSTYWTGGWVELRTGVDAVVKKWNPTISPAENWIPVVQGVA